MTPAEAAKLLDLPADATPEQLEARFLELRRKLEDKIAKAPTPGLQAKYRETLAQITTAFETLTLAADSSSLPVLQRQKTEDGGQRTASPVGGVPPPREASAQPAVAKKKSSGKEFAVVAVVAVAVLGAGGWWIMHLRAEKAEQARIATEIAAQAAAEGLRVKQAEEARVAADTKAAAQLRTQLATAKVAWEALENRLREAERRTSDAKSESRGFRDGPAWKKAELSAMAQRHEMFSSWLNEHLVSHPAKVARATAEQLLSDKLTNEAAEAVAEMREEIAGLQQSIPERAARMLEGTAEVKIESQPAGVKFIYTDAYGRATEGVTPVTLDGQPLSHLHNPKYDGDAGDTEVQVGEFTVTPSVRFIRTGWRDVVESGRTSLAGASFSAEFPEGKLEITSKPAGLKFTVTQHQDLGWTATGTAPAVLTGVPVGDVRVIVERPGYGKSWQNLGITVGETSRTLPLGNESQEVNIAVTEAQAKIFVDQKFVGRGQARVLDLVPGEHALQIEADGYPPFRTKFKVTTSTEKLPVFRFHIKELAIENINCVNCSASGIVQRAETCAYCGGRGWDECGTCGDDGYEWVDPGFFAGGPYKRRCGACNGTKRRPCGFFGRDEKQCAGDGIARWRESCQTCGGDGRVSRLQLSK